MLHSEIFQKFFGDLRNRLKGSYRLPQLSDFSQQVSLHLSYICWDKSQQPQDPKLRVILMMICFQPIKANP